MKNKPLQNYLLLVFEYKNKNYGAYHLRVKYAKRVILSFSIVLSLIFVWIGVDILKNLGFFESAKLPDISIDEIENLNSGGKGVFVELSPPPEIIAPEPETKEIKEVKLVEKKPVKKIEKKTTKPPKTENSTVDTSSNNQTNGNGTGDTGRGVGNGNNEGDKIALSSDVSYLGGEKAWHSFVFKNLRYPKMERLTGKKGLVTYTFIVNTDGSISDIKLLKSVSPNIDKEALRLIKESEGNWIPARTMQGKSVKSQMKVEIAFTPF